MSDTTANPVYGSFLTHDNTIEFGWCFASNLVPGGDTESSDFVNGILESVYSLLLNRLEAIGKEPESMDIDWDLIREAAVLIFHRRQLDSDAPYALMYVDTMNFDRLLSSLVAVQDSEDNSVVSLPLHVVPLTPDRINMPFDRQFMLGDLA